MGDDSGEFLAALVSRLPSTCTIRCRSAMIQGRSAARSMSISCRPPPLRKPLRASATRRATSVGSGETASVPVSMRATSSRSLISTCIRSTWVLMIRKNCRISAGFSAAGGSNRVVMEPLTEVSGVRSSWLTIARNSARSRSSSSSGVRSCRVTTKVSTSPSSERMGVALSSAVTLRPSGTRRTISSARTVSPALSSSAIGSSMRESSRPSPRRQVKVSRSCSGDCAGSRRLSTILFASRLNDTGTPVLASKTATPTGEVWISVSRSALARRSSRYRRALAMTIVACEANIISVSSSSRVNSGSPCFSARKKLPTRPPRWKTGAARKDRTGFTGMGKLSSGRPSDLKWPSRSVTLNGS